jgi:hypothetical protein
LIIKLAFGQAMAPVPWPIQSRSIAIASRPTIKSNLRINVSSVAGRILDRRRSMAAPRNVSRATTVAADR